MIALNAEPWVEGGIVLGWALEDHVAALDEVDHAILRMCRRAGLPERAWHCLRHTFGTHAALCGVNPWSLQAWMGHKSINTTMGYVHVAGDHRSTVPPEVLRAALGEEDLDQRVIKMLSARANVELPDQASQEPETDAPMAL